MSNFNFNKVIIGGRLTADPELKYTPTGIPVASFTVAVNRKVKSGEESIADFLNVTAWRTLAEFITKYFKKSSSICIVGKIQTRSWTDQEGKKRFGTEIVADEAWFVDSKHDMTATASSAAEPSSYIPDSYTEGFAHSTEPDGDAGGSGNDELPF